MDVFESSATRTGRSMTRIALIALVITAGAIGVWLGGLRGGERETETAPSVSTRESVLAARAHEIETPERRIDADERGLERATDEQREPIRVAGTMQPVSPFGTLVLSVVDHSALGPLRSYRARVASETRFADESGDGSGRDLELRLTPGTYSTVIFSPGYETVELAPVAISRGETVRIPRIDLQPGTGRIEGSVIGDVSPDRKFTVELLGEGRHPCARCRDVEAPPQLDAAKSKPDWAWEHAGPCSVCGFERTCSNLTVSTGDRFAFENLASGCYALRLKEGAQETIGEERRIVLAVGEVQSILFDISQTRAVMVELLDVDGSSLSGAWAGRLTKLKTREGVVSLVSYTGTSSVRFVFLENQRDIAQATFERPAPRDQAVRPSAFGSRKLGNLRSKTPSPPIMVDRARTAADALHPECGDPHFAVSQLSCTIDPNGVLRLEPLPLSPLELRVSMGTAAAAVAIPASQGNIKVSVGLAPSK
jgi:hypothetical protein